MLRFTTCWNATMETSEVSAGTQPTSSAEIAMENSADCSDLSNSTTLLMLNEDAFQEILTHLTYDEVARLRMVCKQFNEACQKVLNKGFMAVQRYHNRCLKEMKAKLPRRESERRAHPLARHIDVLTGCDIFLFRLSSNSKNINWKSKFWSFHCYSLIKFISLYCIVWFILYIILTRVVYFYTGIETRLSLLSMTYYKYTALGVFCFIPGKVSIKTQKIIIQFWIYINKLSSNIFILKSSTTKKHNILPVQFN